MAPTIIAVKRVRSSTNSRRKQLLLPALLERIQEVRDRAESTTNNSMTTSPLISLSDLSDALDSPPVAKAHTDDIKAKGVRFNSKVSIVEVPAPDQTPVQRVSFSDTVIDIDTAAIVPSSPSPPKKRVRFGCLKNSVRKHLSHMPMYKMKSYEAISPFVTSKKRVRFGCMKGEAAVVGQSNAGVDDLMADEAATFKREKRRGSSSTEDSEMSEKTTDSDESGVD
jgi:hypothetical protein